MKCQKHLITQYRRFRTVPLVLDCPREAIAVRVTPSGREIHLCGVCDNVFGEAVGLLKSKGAIFHGAPSSGQPVTRT
jgi:hypothetical protein